MTSDACISDRKAGGSGRRATWACLLAIVLLAGLFHWPLLLQGKTVSSFDFCYFGMKAFEAERPPDVDRASNGLLSDPVVAMHVWDLAMLQGGIRFPWLWNPYAGCGAPLLANAQSAVFWPLKYVSLVAGVRRSFGVACFLKMVLAGLFMWLYLRRIGLGRAAGCLGSLAFMACGFVVVWLQFPLGSAAILLPLLLLACEDLLVVRFRRGVLLLGGTLALSFTAGHPETSFHQVVIVAMYTVGMVVCGKLMGQVGAGRGAWRVWAALAGGCLLGVVLAAAQVLPTAEYILHSNKLLDRQAMAVAGRNWFCVWAGGWVYAYREILSYLVPNTWGNPAVTDHWWNEFSSYNASAGYVGAGMLWMALSAWGLFRRDARVRALCLLQVLSLAVIVRFAVVESLMNLVPVLNVAANKRMILLWCFTSVVLACVRFDRLLKGERPGRVMMLGAAVVLLALFGLVLWDYVGRFAGHAEGWVRRYGRRQIIHFTLALLPFFSVLFLPQVTARRRALMTAGLTVLLAADLLVAHGGYNPFIRPERLYPETDAIRFLRTASPSSGRVLPLGRQLVPNLLTAYRLQDPRSYDGLMPLWYQKYLNHLNAKSRWWNIVERPNWPLVSLSSVRWVWADEDWSPDGPGLQAVYEDAYTRIYENTNALPRAFVATGWRHVSSTDEAFAVVLRPGFAWTREVAVEAAADGRAPVPAGVAALSPVRAASIHAYGAHRVEIDLPPRATGILVLTDTFWPGWTARVDGQVRPIHRVNGLFRGVMVDDAARRVVFVYRPRSFRLGLFGSAVGLLAFVAVAVVRRRPSARSVRSAEHWGPV